MSLRRINILCSSGVGRFPMRISMFGGTGLMINSARIVVNDGLITMITATSTMTAWIANCGSAGCSGKRMYAP